MKVVIQRAKHASVSVDGKVIGEIDKGLLLLVGITHDDQKKDAEYAAGKVADLRIFEDAEGKMNHSLIDVNGAVLSISQFTLYGDTRKGRRPSFIEAAKPAHAEPLYDYFNQLMIGKGIRVETGKFGAMMDVSFTNEGPVTLVVESHVKKS